MPSRPALSAILAALLALAIVPAHATDEHDYAKGEYLVIDGGLAPDKQHSLAAHADQGGGHFHVWLMAEPAHRRIVPLADIEARLDNAPRAYHAKWSADSRHAGVAFRSDRHAWELNLYDIEHRRAYPLTGPTLFRDVTNRDIGADDDVRTSFSDVEWRGARRFVLRQHLLLRSSDPGFARRLGAYGKPRTEAMDGGTFVEFAAEADCVLLPGHRYRIVDLRVGKFTEE